MEDFKNKEEYELIRERIKTRPINRKKLFRRTVITASMAVIFGVLACITFLVLEPVFSKMLSHDEAPLANEISIPLDEEETLPQDLLLEDKVEKTQPQIIIKDSSETTTQLESYVSLYNEIYNMSRICQRSMVSVAGVSQDTDWFNNEYESQNVSSGLIVANNGIELLVLTDSSIFSESEAIEVTFFNELVANGTIKETDKNTGLAIVAVSVDQLTDTVLDPANIAKLGNSKNNRIFASPVIALGNPLGNVISIEKGLIISQGTVINMPDSNYEIFTTDMDGTAASNGVIFDMSGEVIGVIYQKSGMFGQSSISAIGISDLKKTIERMANGNTKTFFGIVGKDVTSKAISQGVPAGAYVKEIKMGSPAMKAGIQSGDVITKIDGFDITSFTVFTESISLHEPEDELAVTIMRLSGDEYKEMVINVVLTEQ